MANFFEANQVRLKLKMQLSLHGWYKSSAVLTSNGDFEVLVHVTKLDNSVRKLIAPVINGISVKVELD